MGNAILKTFEELLVDALQKEDLNLVAHFERGARWSAVVHDKELVEARTMLRKIQSNCLLAKNQFMDPQEIIQNNLNELKFYFHVRGNWGKK